MIALKPIKSIQLQTTLYDFQVRALEWCADKRGAVIAAGMGTGKTVIAMGIYCKTPHKTLYVCPKSLVEQIKSEYEKHISRAGKVCVYVGADRNIRELMLSTFVITTYDILVQEGADSYLQTNRWGHIFLDEAHIIRNPKTLKHKFTVSLQSYYGRWCLTGTPLINKAKDLDSLATFIRVKPEDIDAFVLRINKDDVLKLPKKNVHYHSVAYSRPRGVDDLHVLTKIVRLKQHSIHPLVGKSRPETVPDSAKFLKVLEIIKNAPEDDKILIFSQYTDALALLSRYLQQHKIDSMMYTGGQSSSSRELSLRFKKILLLSLHAGSVGLNITQANHVVFLEPWWNQAIEQQATDRVHRIGQRKEVHVHHLISSGSLEKWIYRLHSAKPSTKSLPPPDVMELTGEETLADYVE